MLSLRAAISASAGLRAVIDDDAGHVARETDDSPALSVDVELLDADGEVIAVVFPAYSGIFLEPSDDGTCGVTAMERGGLVQVGRLSAAEAAGDLEEPVALMLLARDVGLPVPVVGTPTLEQVRDHAERGPYPARLLAEASVAASRRVADLPVRHTDLSGRRPVRPPRDDPGNDRAR